MPDYRTLDQVADIIGVEVTSVRRALKKMKKNSNIEVVRGMVPDRSRRALCVTTTDVEKIVAYFRDRQKQSVYTNARNDSTAAVSHGGFGYFYISQLAPEALPNRVKLGYTDNLETRLREHQTAAPTAQIIKSWSCKRAWELAAIDSITRSDCKLVLNEVYEGDVEKFVQRGEEFFSVMPNAKVQVPLSFHSPLASEEESCVKVAGQDTVSHNKSLERTC